MHSTSQHEVGYLTHGGKLEIMLVGKLRTLFKQTQKIVHSTRQQGYQTVANSKACVERTLFKQTQKPCIPPVNTKEATYHTVARSKLSLWGKGRGLELVLAAYNYGTCNGAGQRGTELTCLMFQGIDCWGNKGKPLPP